MWDEKIEMPLIVSISFPKFIKKNKKLLKSLENKIKSPSACITSGLQLKEKFKEAQKKDLV